MPKRFRIVPVLLLACVICGCGSSNVSPVDEQADAVSDAADILATIKDKASAQLAKPKVEAVAARLRVAQKKRAEMVSAGNWKEPSEADKRRLAVAVARYNGEVNRLSKAKVEGSNDLIWKLATAMNGLPESAAE